MKGWQVLLIGLVAGALTGYFISRHFATFQPVSETYKVRVDTLYLKDTIRVYEPKIVLKTQTDTIWQSVQELVEVHDTLFVPLVRERVVYQDTAYKAVVSGVMPSLDELEIYQRERIVTVQTEHTVRVRSRWGVGLQVGAGVNTQGQALPYIGVGVSYNLLNF